MRGRGRGYRVEGLRKKEKRFMDMDNSVVIAGVRGVEGDKMVVGKIQ